MSSLLFLSLRTLLFAVTSEDNDVRKALSKSLSGFFFVMAGPTAVAGTKELPSCRAPASEFSPLRGSERSFVSGRPHFLRRNSVYAENKLSSLDKSGDNKPAFS